MNLRHRPARRLSRMIESLERRQLLAAATPTLIKDLNTKPDTTFEPTSMFSTGSVAYFTQLDVNVGAELWRTDGTAAGTVLVKDIVPGKAGSNPGNFVQLGTTVYFSAGTESSGSELWKTDGTAAGTVMVTDAVPGTGSSYPTNLRVAGSKLYFFATTPATGYEVWSSDGTAAGTSMIVDLRPGPIGQAQYYAPTKAGTVGSTFLYAASNGTTSGVYRTDGTAAGTSLLISSSTLPLDTILSGTSRAILTPAATNSSFFSTDGTAANTVALGQAYTPTAIAVAGTNVFYFDSFYPAGLSLYRKPVTGGTASQITLPAGLSDPVPLGALGSTFLFTAQSSSGVNLYQATSNGLGATLLKDFSANDNRLFAPTVIGTSLYFINQSTQELWRTSGTSASTVAVATVSDLYYSSYDNYPKMVGVGSRVVLVNSSSTTGKELWSYDPATASLAILKDINTGTAAYGGISWYVGRIGDTLFYQLNDGVTGGELYRTDGTAAGTSLVKDIEPGTYWSSPFGGLTLGNKLLFRANTGATGTELWVTDGTAAGTLPIDIVPGPASSNASLRVVMNGVAYFTASTPAAGTELWRTDGTAAGTFMVTDLYAGATDSDPSSITVLNGRLYFAATTAAAGTELWSSDGTAAGTTLVKNIAPGTASSTPSAMIVADGKLVFAATESATGTEVWISDGTAGGTTRISDLNAGSASASPAQFTKIGSTVYFAATTAATGRELFKLDLNSMTASLAADVVPGATGSSPNKLVQLGELICFDASASVGSDLYTFDGTTLVRRTNFAATNGYGIEINGTPLKVINGALFFSAEDGVHNIELYEFDGAASSTVQMTDLFPGLYSGAPENFAALPDAAVFTALTPAYGGELYRVQDTAAPRAWAKTLDLNTGPRVRVEWTEAVIAAASSATLISLKTNQPVPGVTVIRTIRSDGSGVDYSFSAKLPDGDYRLQFNAADFRDAAGNVATGVQQHDFFILAGDVNRDRTVGFADLVIVAQNYGKSGRTFSEGNLDNDAAGLVNFADLVILAQQYNAQAAAITIVPVASAQKKRAVARDVIA